MGRQYVVDDSQWDEVMIINWYAVFMGYLMTGVRGLGLLVVTWTTVVLLGGFVSDLGRKDFWCLTGITLIQVAGVFNFLLTEKLSDVLHFCIGLLATIVAPMMRGGRGIEHLQWKSVVIAFILLVIQGLILGIILCPLGVLYMFGLYISAGVSLWRLIEHDFGNKGGANQKPALQVLYSLAVAQGVLFGYKTIHALGARNRLAKFAAAEFVTVDEELVAEYLEETVAGCEKDPSFANRRNLVTYGVGLMVEAKSNEGFIAGIRVLGGAIKRLRGPKVLGKHLLTSRSDFWSHMFQRLLKILCGGSPYSKEVREHAARIVALVARDIHLQQFPGMIECISSVLELQLEGPSAKSYSYLDVIRRRLYADELKDYERVALLEEYELEYLIHDRKGTDSPDFFLSNMILRLAQCFMCEGKATKSSGRQMDNRVHSFDGLLMEAAKIIQQLAVNEDNRRIMSKAVIHSHKFSMALDKLHGEADHGAILEKYWVQWLVAAIKEINSQRRAAPEEGQPAARAAGTGAGTSGEEEIQEAVEEGLVHLGTAISNINHTVKSIFDCLDCGATQKMQVVQILLHLYLDMSFIMDSESSRRRLTWILLLVFYCEGYDDPKHWMVISGFTGSSMNNISHLAGEKLSDMLGKKLQPPSKGDAMVLHIIQDITSAFVDDSEDMSIRIHAVMIMQILCTRYYNPHNDDLNKKVVEILVGATTKVVNEILGCASTGEEKQAQEPDVEKGVSEDDVLERSKDKERFRKALVSLCQGGYMEHRAFRPKFEEIAVKVCEEQGKSFEDFKLLLV